MKNRLSPQQILKTIRSLRDCANMCQITCTLLREKKESESRMIQLRLLQDCKDICNLCLKYIEHSSTFAKSLCFFCVGVCRACGEEYLKQTDYQSKACSQICFECARECRIFALRI